ncbi:MAG TPA: hypothetical protein PLK90_09725 [Clostridiales bacterium]|nr:hypothetical protein [Clostridiales bacterium]HQP70664.1 hypothetical protein [Clostridiales bacterium]
MKDKLKILSPDSFTHEKEYIFGLISEFIGVEFDLHYEKRADYKIVLPNGKTIVFSDSFFSKIEGDYVKEEYIPNDISFSSSEYAQNLPVIFGNDSLSEDETGITSGFDLPASVFFMISRWEEAAVKDKDDHGRFPSEKSLAVKAGIIRRPVVDEYFLMLKKMINRLDNSVILKDHDQEVTITCDVDSFEKFLKGKTLKMFAGHLVKRFDPFLFISDLFKFTVKTFFGTKDPYDKFSRIYSIAERSSTKPVYFILTSPEGPYNDGWFTVSEKDIDTFKSLKAKGAEIGLHYGYFSLMNEKNILNENTDLEKKYKLKAEKGRAHFLQVDIRSSFDILEKSGIKDDYSLGYSRYAGFRCGTGRSFRPWDIDRKREYNIIEHPLIVMDTTLYAHNKLKKDGIKAEFEYFKNISKNYQTDLTVLIHNSSPAYVFEAVENLKA